MSMGERDVMEYDVAVVGGPAGLDRYAESAWDSLKSVVD